MTERVFLFALTLSRDKKEDYVELSFILLILPKFCIFIVGASLSEPKGVMMSTALVCVQAYVHTCRRGLPGND